MVTKRKWASGGKILTRVRGAIANRPQVANLPHTEILLSRENVETPATGQEACPTRLTLNCRFMETRTIDCAHDDLTVSRACFGTMTFGMQADERTAGR